MHGLKRTARWLHWFLQPPPRPIRVAVGNRRVALHEEDPLAACEGLLFAFSISLLFWSALTFTLLRLR